MHVSWGFCIDSVLLFLFLNVLTYATVLPYGDEHSSPDKSQGAAILPQQPASQGSHKSQHVSLRSAGAMIQRDDEQSDDLRIIRIDIVTGSIPILAAANSLDMFYNAILYNALAPWCSVPPQQTLVITMGHLQLTMNVVFDDGVPRGIPWAFVRNFARNMLGMTAMGFTGTFDMYYATDYGLSFNHDLPNLGVEVRLRIVWGI
ncbi:MAG: hypothetical protein Q9175_005603 [Cornicularia normoerica]